MRNPFRRSAPEQRLTMKEWTTAWEEVLSLKATTKAGQPVTPPSSLKCSVVYACVKVISETIASLPLFVYQRRPDGGKEPAYKDYRWKLLHDKPNAFQTAFEWKEMLAGHSCLRGNHMSFIKKTVGGKILAIEPLNPTWFKEVDQDSQGRVRYVYQYQDTGKEEYFWREDLVHIKLFSEDGLVGLSPIEMARESIGLALGGEEYSARFFSNDARPGGILEHPGRISEDAAKRLKKQWDEAHAGASRAHGTVVLEEGLKWHQVGLSNEDSQFLESRGFQVEEIARIFRVPAVLIGHPNTTMTYASAEQFFMAFVTHTIRPWLVRIEQVLNTALFKDEDLFCEFKLDSLMRGDTQSRYNAYSLALQNKWMTRNEVRALENLNPVEGGDEFENPAITVTPNDQPQGGNDDEPDD